jgi:hypothetical protein
MTVRGNVPDPAPAVVGTVTRLNPVDAPGVPGLVAARQPGVPGIQAEKPFDRVARLAAMVVGTPLASVTITGEHPSSGRICPGPLDIAGQPDAVSQVLCQRVIDSEGRLVIDDARVDPHVTISSAARTTAVIAWAGFPVHGPDGHVVGALCVADYLPRHWSTGDVEVLETLAYVASGEVALQVAVQHGAVRGVLAETLQESLLPPRLPIIPGLQVAARYVAGGTGAEVLGDFYDVFPSVRGSWGMVVGDVCGKGVPAAKSTALARYTLRAEAHRETRPRLILAALNQALLEWPTDDPRFLTAIYATVRPTAAEQQCRSAPAVTPWPWCTAPMGTCRHSGSRGPCSGSCPILICTTRAGCCGPVTAWCCSPTVSPRHAAMSTMTFTARTGSATSSPGWATCPRRGSRTPSSRPCSPSAAETVATTPSPWSLRSPGTRRADSRDSYRIQEIVGAAASHVGAVRRAAPSNSAEGVATWLMWVTWGQVTCWLPKSGGVPG